MNKISRLTYLYFSKYAHKYTQRIVYVPDTDTLTTRTQHTISTHDTQDTNATHTLRTYNKITILYIQRKHYGCQVEMVASVEKKKYEKQNEVLQDSASDW